MPLPPILASLAADSSSAEDPSQDLDHPSSERLAAVLVLLFPRPAGEAFLLTRRASGLGRHAGQISLPGGVMEPQDENLWETALRETREELGVRTGRSHRVVMLKPTPARVSDLLITPFVAWNPVAPLIRPDPAEVEEVIEVPLSVLLDPESVEEETWELRGSQWRVAFYRLQDEPVWGITARVLSELAQRLQETTTRLQLPPGAVVPA